MHFKFSKRAQKFFGNIISLEGSHSSDKDRNEFKFKQQFDVYYCCALIGMAACKIDEDSSDLKDLTEKYPKEYYENRMYIAGLLVASEAKRQGIDSGSPNIEELMLQYLSNDEGTYLTDNGVKMLNAYALEGFNIITQFLPDKPTSREEFLEAFKSALDSLSSEN